jgi:alpha-1,3-rhamnosyl/mannosyltransferase
VRVVPHGYDEAFGQPSPTGKIQAVRRAYHLDRPYLLSIGRVEEKKNSAALIRAWDRLQTIDAKYKEFDLVCIGKPGFGYDAVMTAVAESPYKDRIRLLGWVPAEDTQALLHDAQAVIFPSRYEGFGIPLLEAMASGVPVVAVRSSGAVEEVGGDAVQYAVNHSPEAIASATHELLIDRALVDTLIDRGERRVRNFSWRRAAEETWKVLSQLY